MNLGSLPVRTNLRVGLVWDDLDDQTAALSGKLTKSRRQRHQRADGQPTA